MTQPHVWVVLVVKNLLASAGDVRDMGSMPETGRSPGGEYGNPLQYSCLANPMDRGAWQAVVHGGCRELDMTERLTFSLSHLGTELVPKQYE